MFSIDHASACAALKDADICSNWLDILKISRQWKVLYLGQALFVVSVLMAKPIFVVSGGLRVFQKNQKLTNFLSILKMKLYSVRCMKYFSLEIFRHNCDFVGLSN